MASSDKVAEAHKTLWDQGIEIRKQVVGPEHVSRSVDNMSDFSRPLQELVTEVGWGVVWARDGLERKTRSLINIGMLCALNKMAELAVHIKGAVNNGATEEEIREVLIQVAVYCGMPAALEGTRVAETVLKSIREADTKAAAEGNQASQ
ncbi:4-carboxymuconolactone decarboxylase [Exophiala mesophila]|uniref:4-carboxymuconolactone decarboxylase n=1 Tax=Exophiala mesophila TaxID=212818 RepID=A0A0D1WQ51_EXOME|nr:4-carboxymuconolactone decarboxylase [Exophiala mesophila]KIV91185.1 4-carboxymuconolactone decarboxylase [Exophiala mesophila]